MMLWLEREAPYFGTSTFAPDGEDGLFLSVKHGDGGLGKDDGAVGIKDCTDSEERVCEGWEDVAFGGGCG